MPYTAKTLPSAVRKLPPHGRRTFQAAFNSAYRQSNGDESKSHAIAWNAVKNKYEKKGSQWVTKTQADEEPMKIVDQLRQAYEYFRSQSPKPDEVDLTGVTEILDQATADPDNFYRLADLDSQFVAAVEFDLTQCYGDYASSTPYQTPGDKERTVEADHHNNFPGSLQHRIRQVLNAFHEDEAQETYLGYFGFVLAVYPDYLITCALDDPSAQTADYWKIGYSFDEQTGAVTFGDATQVDVGTVVVPQGTMMAETPEEEDAEQGADPVTQMEGADGSGEYGDTQPTKADGKKAGKKQDDGQDFKTENGQKFPKSAYLIVGDPKSPSTWKVRIQETPGKVTTSQLGAAHAALTKGFRGNKVQAGPGAVATALTKLKGLYKTHGAEWPEDKKQSYDGVTVIAVKTDDRPDWLKQGHEPPGGDEELVQSQSYVLQADGYNETTGVLHVKGTATTADVINSKRQVYPKEVWEDNLPRLIRKLGQGKLVGESEHPADGQASLDRTCVKFTKLWQDGNETKFEADILPTEPFGKNLQILIQNGVAVDISSRGRGTTKIGEWRGTPDVAIVQRGFRCDAFDCVVAGASPNSTITDWQLQSTTADEEDDMPALTPDQQAQLDKMAAFADKFDTFLAAQAQNGTAPLTASTNIVVQEQSQTASTNTPSNADAERIEKNLAKMEKTMVTGLKMELLQEASKKWPQVWVNLYKKRLEQCGANTPEELETASVRAIEDIDSLYQSAPKFPGNGFTVEPDKGDRGFQRPIDLIEEMTRDLSDEFENASDPKGIFTQKDSDGKPILPGWFRTPRRQCQKMLMNIATHVDEAWNGPAAMNALLRLSQGYGAGEVDDYLYQTISPAGTTAVGAGGAPSSAIFIFPLVRRVFPQLIATELASVQPMDRPDGKIFFLDSYRVSTGVDSLDEAGATVSDRMRIDRSDSFSSSYANDPGETATANIIQLRLSSQTVTAQTKKLYGNWSIEEMQDLRAYHGLDAALELVGSLSREIALEWNETVLSELVAGATGSARHYGTTAPSGYTQKEWDEYITRYIDAVSNDIFAQRYGDITHIIAGPTAWLKMGAAFRVGTNPRSGPEPEQYAGLTLTPFMAASMPNVKTYKTGFFRNVNSNIILCLRRGTDWSDTPYVWAPYLDYVSPTLTLPDGFTQKQGLMSRVAHRVVVGAAIGTVTIDSGVTGVTL